MVVAAEGAEEAAAANERQLSLVFSRLLAFRFVTDYTRSHALMTVTYHLFTRNNFEHSLTPNLRFQCASFFVWYLFQRLIKISVWLIAVSSI